MSSIIVFWLVLLIMAVGAIGTLLPIMPGTPLIFLAALGFGFYEHFQRVTPFILVVLFVLTVISLGVDYFAGVIGAKKYGASRYGTWGSFIGGIAGVIIFSIPGLLIGPFTGAVIGEIVSGRNPGEALKVGLGTVIGMAGGAVFKLIIAVSMIVVFLTGVV